MKTRFIFSKKENGVDYFYYECPCRKGYIIEEMDLTTEGNKEFFSYMECPTCKSIYDLDRSRGELNWSIVRKNVATIHSGHENAYRLKVALIDGNGKIIDTQDYNEFVHEEKKSSLVIPLYGRKLVDILINETGSISFEENKFVLKEILQLNVRRSIIPLLGRVAEAVLVRNCADDSEKNRKWLQKARRVSVHSEDANKYYAIGTGLNSTKKEFPRRYNSSDTQNDIIWVNKDGIPVLVGGSNGECGITAGLQVKVSSQGESYVVPDLVKERYESPIVYFPLRDDFERVFETYAIRKQNRGFDMANDSRLKIGEDFIDVRTIDNDAYEEIKAYYPLIRGLMSGKVTPDELVETSINKPALENAILGNALQRTKSGIYVFH